MNITNLNDIEKVLGPDWKQLIQEPPFCIKVKEEGNYILLKYNQLNSNMSIPLVQQLRGKIFRADDGACVCYPFDKFFNYGQPEAATINWERASVLEKVDGSLTKIWWDNNQWHLSTNGNIDAFAAAVNDFDTTFGELFIEVAGCSLEELMAGKSQAHTYLFELVSPMNKVVVRYDEPAIYYLGSIITAFGSFRAPNANDFPRAKIPKIYPLNSLEECIECANTMSQNEEGFVVWDGVNRVKIKSPAYLAAAYAHNNGNITFSRIIEMILNEMDDDFVGMFPEYDEKISAAKRALTDLIERTDTAAARLDTLCFTDRKEMAAFIFTQAALKPYANFLFNYVDNKVKSAREYYGKMEIRKLCDLVKEKMG